MQRGNFYENERKMKENSKLESSGMRSTIGGENSVSALEIRIRNIKDRVSRKGNNIVFMGEGAGCKVLLPYLVLGQFFDGTRFIFF
jgi:hypothetical protein